MKKYLSGCSGAAGAGTMSLCAVAARPCSVTTASAKSQKAEISGEICPTELQTSVYHDPVLKGVSALGRFLGLVRHIPERVGHIYFTEYDPGRGAELITQKQSSI